MTRPAWFLFDLGNTVIKLGYERVVAAICADSDLSPGEVAAVLEQPGFYRDLERGAMSFRQFHAALQKRAAYRGDLKRFHAVWSDFFDGPVPGIEELLVRIRQRYRVAFLSNSNEVHAEVIPRQFPSLFREDDRFVFSHRCKAAKPDPEIFRQAVALIGTVAAQVVFIDDLIENVEAARAFGMRAFHFEGTQRLERELAEGGLL